MTPAARRESFEQVAERLYGLPLDEFTSERDAAAKQLRQHGDREAAEQTKRLRKPNLVAWALNRVRREQHKQTDALIAAGERLQEAQRQLVSAGERGLLRQAAGEERELVGQVVELAQRELAAAGHAADAGAQGKLFSTLHAAAGNGEVREQLRSGRLVSDHQISDLGLGDAAALAAATPSPLKRGATSKERAAKPKRDAARTAETETEAAKARAARAEAAERRATERKAKAVTGRLERARERSDQLAQKAKEARRRLSEARRTAEEAAREAERAGGAAQRADQAAEDAGRAVSELEAELVALDCKQ